MDIIERSHMLITSLTSLWTTLYSGCLVGFFLTGRATRDRGMRKYPPKTSASDLCDLATFFCFNKVPKILPAM